MFDRQEVQRLKREINERIKHTARRGGVRATIQEVGGSFDVTGRAGYVWARIGDSLELIPILRNNAPLVDDLPVIVDKTPSGDWEYVGIDEGAAVLFIASGGVSSVGWHTHNVYNAGFWDLVDPHRVQGGRVAPNGAAIEVVTDGDFWYVHRGAHAVLEDGATLDISGDQPAAGEWVWVKVGVDPATNALTSAAGTAQSTMSTLTTAQLLAIDLDGAYPLAGVKLRGNATRLYENDIVDLRFTTAPISPGPLVTGIVQQPETITWAQTVLDGYQAVWHGGVTLEDDGALTVLGSVYIME